MIQKLNIKDFQVHEKLSLTFSPGINTIVGASDVGKSAIIRALRWVSSNSPAGDDFIRHGTKGAEVSVTANDLEIFRSNISGKNLYSLGTKEFTAFKRDVPSEIKQTLKIEDINFQNQFDAPYWFQETAGEVSRQLNSIVNLEIIDEVLSSLTSSKNSANSEVAVSENRIKSLKEQKEELSFVLEMDSDYSAIESMDKTNKQLEELSNDLSSLLLEYARYKKIKESNAEKSQDLSSILIIGAKYTETEKTWNVLFGLEQHRLTLQKTIKASPPSMEAIEEAKKKHKEAIEACYDLDDLLSRYDRLKTEKEECLYEAEQYAKQIKDEIGDRCPLCDNIMKGPE